MDTSIDLNYIPKDVSPANNIYLPSQHVLSANNIDLPSPVNTLIDLNKFPDEVLSPDHAPGNTITTSTKVISPNHALGNTMTALAAFTQSCSQQHHDSNSRNE